MIEIMDISKVLNLGLLMILSIAENRSWMWCGLNYNRIAAV